MKKITWHLFAPLIIIGVLLGACSPATTPAATQAPTTAAATVAAATTAPTGAPTEVPTPALPNCGTDPIVMKAVFETGWDMPGDLAKEFTKEFPNVTWDISMEQFANLITTTPLLLASDKPPDMIGLPSMTSCGMDCLLL